MIALRSAIVVGIVALGASASLGYAHRPDAGAGAHAASIEAPGPVGPQPLGLPADAALARDAAELAVLVADPAGPTVIALVEGIHRLDLDIRRAVRLVGARGAVIEGSGTRTVVSIEADDVQLENLIIQRSGRRHAAEDAGIKAKGARIALRHVHVRDTLFGITLQLCPNCLVEACHVVGLEDDPELRGDAIKLWESDHSVVRGNLVEDSRDIVVWYARHVTLEDNVVTRSRYGSHFMYAHDSVVRRSRVIGNVVGIFVMYSSRVRAEDNVVAGARGAAGIGFGFKEADDVTLVRNHLVANTTGAYLDQTPRKPGSTLVLEGNVIALNDVGLKLHGSEKGAQLLDNDFHANAVTVQVDGGGKAGGVVFHGNHYSDYEGYDLDRDGYGDVAYQQKLLSGELTDQHPALRFFHGTAAMSMIDAIAHAVPVLSAKVLMADARPRMERLRQD